QARPRIGEAERGVNSGCDASRIAVQALIPCESRRDWPRSRGCGRPTVRRPGAVRAARWMRGYDIDATTVTSPTIRYRGHSIPPMIALTEHAVLDALRNVREPELPGDLVSRDMIKNLVIDGSRVSFTIELTTPACPLKDEIEADVGRVLKPLGAETIEVSWGAVVRRSSPNIPQQQVLPGVKNVIAIASGKGGVGKSTVSVNLAVALAQAGASVGLLDADITGPNIPQMIGAEGQPKATPAGKIEPLERYGVKVISIQFFVPEGQPVVW